MSQQNNDVQTSSNQFDKEPIYSIIPQIKSNQNNQQNNEFLQPLKEPQSIIRMNLKPVKKNTQLKKQSNSSTDQQSKRQSKQLNNKKPSPNKQASTISNNSIQQMQSKELLAKKYLLINQNNVLQNSGILDAYEHFLKLLCKNGLPTGRVYDYAAQQILKYQKRKRNKELKMRAELDIQKIVKKSSFGQLTPQKDKSLSASRKQ